MYSDEGVNTDVVKALANYANPESDMFLAESDFNMLNPKDVIESLGVDANLSKYLVDPISGSLHLGSDVLNEYDRFTDNVFGQNSAVSDILQLGGATGAIGGALSDLGSAIWGNSAKAKGKAKEEARRNAIRNFENKFNQYLTDQGFANQFSLANDQETLERQQDFLNNILGRLDTTNL